MARNRRSRCAGIGVHVGPENAAATEEQKEFLRGVSGEGYCAVIAQGFDEAKATLEWYLGITDHEPPSTLKTKLICLAHNSSMLRGRQKKKK
jgi:hypothetical protein